MVFVWACGRKGRALTGEWDRIRLGVLEERQGWEVGALANKVWGQPVTLAGSAPRPCGHEDLNRSLRPQVVKISDAAEEGSVRKQQQSGRRSRARVHRVFWFLVCYAATQIATPLHQRHIQVVRSNKVAQKRQTKSNGTAAMDLGHTVNVVLM